MDDHPDVLGYLKGEEDASTHVEQCGPCRLEIDETRSVLSLLHTLPEIEPAPHVWSRIETRIAPRRVGVMRPALWVAAAASVLVAVLSFIVVFTRPADRLAATVSAASPGSTALPGTRINIGDTFHSPSLTTLTLPDAGTLTLNRKTTIRFDDRRRVALLQGELYAEITPDGRGFEIASGESRVTVHGTKFGVKCGEAVYVVEGKVGVAGPQGSTTLAAGEVGNLRPERIAGPAALARAQWVRSMERPTVAMRVRGSTVVSSGTRWDLAFSSDAPVLIDDPRGAQHVFILLVTNPDGRSYSVTLDSARFTGTSAHGKFLLDVDQEMVLSCTIEPGLFQEGGAHTVSIVYFARDSKLEAVESDPLKIEVRP